MAFSVRIIGQGVGYGETLLDLEPMWWSADTLMRDPRFVEERDETGSYLDYTADLTVAEARQLHEQFREEAVTGLYGDEGWRERTHPLLHQLDAAFGPRAHEFGRFLVRVFEWESGY